MPAAARAHRPAEAAPPLRRADEPGIAVLTLARPESRNALSDAMLAALSGALAAIAAEPRTRAVVLAAEGPVFSAGHDLKELTAARADPDGGRAAFARVLADCTAVMTAVVRLPQPVIAAVEGTATAAGCQLVAACDLAVAGAGARFCTPGANIGLFCSTPMVALSRDVARKHALEMLLLGEMIDAAEAHRFGLVNRVVPAGGALEGALALARRIASRSPAALRLGKRAFHEGEGLPLDQAYEAAGRVMLENLLDADAVEGFAAVLGKRDPVWPGA